MRIIGFTVIVLSLLAAGCSSPASIVEEAVTAAAQGDRDAYVGCFTPRSRALLRSLYTIADAKKPELALLGEQGAQITSVQPLSPGDLGQSRAMVTLAEGEQTLSLVVHSNAGAWRIDLMDSERVLTGSAGRF